MLVNIFFCQNQINYEIANCIASKGDWILLEKGIIKYSKNQARHLNASKILRSFTKWIIRLNLVKGIYVPHHKVISTKLTEMRAAKVHYLDDGLDALRIQPKNFTGNISAGQRYFTFLEYNRLPAWFDAAYITRVVSLTTLATKKPPESLTVPNEDFLIIESPNLNLENIKNYVQNKSVCYLEHRIPDKRLKHVPAEWRRDRFGAYTESVIFGGYKGTVIAGDTMVSVVLHHLQDQSSYKFMYVGDEIPSIPKAVF